MAGKRHTEEQIIGVLKESEAEPSDSENLRSPLALGEWMPSLS